MLSEGQNTIVYLMFLSGIIFLGFRFIARALVQQRKKKSKILGYAALVSALMVFCLSQQYEALVFLEFPPRTALHIVVGGMAVPVFFISLVYYRMSLIKPRLKDDVDHE